MMSDVVERVAKAIVTHMDVFSNVSSGFANAPATADWSQYSPIEQAAARLAARAAIAAMSEPGKMKEVG